MIFRQSVEKIEEFARLKLQQELNQFGLDPRQWNVIQDKRSSKGTGLRYFIQSQNDEDLCFVGLAKRERKGLCWQEIAFDISSPLSA